ncbi:MAG TPA: hypothetical protein VMT05_01655 [Terriglobales bacterium]|nr:hypothetical protein [Terriglobales bacterium]
MKRKQFGFVLWALVTVAIFALYCETASAQLAGKKQRRIELDVVSNTVDADIVTVKAILPAATSPYHVKTMVFLVCSLQHHNCGILPTGKQMFNVAPWKEGHYNVLSTNKFGYAMIKMTPVVLLGD